MAMVCQKQLVFMLALCPLFAAQDADLSGDTALDIGPTASFVASGKIPSPSVPSRTAIVRRHSEGGDHGLTHSNGGGERPTDAPVPPSCTAPTVESPVKGECDEGDTIEDGEICTPSCARDNPPEGSGRKSKGYVPDEKKLTCTCSGASCVLSPATYTCHEERSCKSSDLTQTGPLELDHVLCAEGDEIDNMEICSPACKSDYVRYVANTTSNTLACDDGTWSPSSFECLQDTAENRQKAGVPAPTPPPPTRPPTPAPGF